MIGPCAKAQVKCTLVTRSGARFVGTNECFNAQPKCPREPGEDYTKCRTICQQLGHAETVALVIAGTRAKGAHAYIEGHNHACKNCQIAMSHAGVAAFTLGAPPPRRTWRTTLAHVLTLLSVGVLSGLLGGALWDASRAGTPSPSKPPSCAPAQAACSKAGSEPLVPSLLALRSAPFPR